MEPQKVFEEMEKESYIRGRLISWLMSLTLILIVGMFGFLWSMSKSMAVLEDHDTQRSALMDKMQTDINQLRSDMSELKVNQAILNLQLKPNPDVKK